ncbi:SoxAX cytochrome complex subunit A [Sulfurimicrobium lacus]|uniref:SoxAX cytochrome complex subunit A n=1 Tax=Sulfurimicrobium lacus TaxID=2715678 RepID=A0A6F8V797_9PROT|nr:sulfur oxidation c-type cytochrome SoxA [Sulfurimicrobium lacus]BCB25568.1 SoxAX cytochrome complex subunit A [Sulfurimicrobium lacus]
MKKIALALLSAGLLVSAVAHAGPEDDRKQLVNYFKVKHGTIKFDDYVHGALAMDKDAKSQYDSIMEFPPFEGVVDAGKEMWEKPFKNGKTFASCFPNGGKNVAGNYPYFDDKLGKVVTFEMAINQCLKDNGEQEFKYGDVNTMGILTAYARTLSDGMRMNVKVSGPAALVAYEAGKDHFFRRRGQLNFSCASCHVDNAGNRIRSEVLSPSLGQATHWPVFRGGENLVTIQSRFVGCNKQVRAVPFAVGSEEYNNLEYYLSYMSNGLPMKASVFRK